MANGGVNVENTIPTSSRPARKPRRGRGGSRNGRGGGGGGGGAGNLPHPRVALSHLTQQLGNLQLEAPYPYTNTNRVVGDPRLTRSLEEFSPASFLNTNDLHPRNSHHRGPRQHQSQPASPGRERTRRRGRREHRRTPYNHHHSHHNHHPHPHQHHHHHHHHHHHQPAYPPHLLHHPPQAYLAWNQHHQPQRSQPQLQHQHASLALLPVDQGMPVPMAFEFKINLDTPEKADAVVSMGADDDDEEAAVVVTAVEADGRAEEREEVEEQGEFGKEVDDSTFLAELQNIYDLTDSVLVQHAAASSARAQREAKKATEVWLQKKTEEEREMYERRTSAATCKA